MQLSGKKAEDKTTISPKEYPESNNTNVQEPEPEAEVKEPLLDVDVVCQSTESSPIECIPPVRPQRTKRSSRIQVPEWTPPKNDLFSYLFGCVKPRVAD